MRTQPGNAGRDDHPAVRIASEPAPCAGSAAIPHVCRACRFSTVNEYAEINIGQRVSTLPGVAQVIIFGQQKYAVRVQVDPDLLAIRGIGLDECSAPWPQRARTRRRRAQRAAKAATLQALIRCRPPRLATSTDHRLPQRGAGAAARRRPLRWTACRTTIGELVHGTRAVTVAIFRQADANTVEVVDQIKALVAGVPSRSPGAIELHSAQRPRRPSAAAVADVQHTLGSRWCWSCWSFPVRAAPIRHDHSRARAPVSIIGTFAAMYLFGYSLDNVLADGADACRRLCGRRCDRYAREHCPPNEAGLSPMQRAQGLARDYLYDHIDDDLAGGGFHPVFFMGGVVGRVFNEFAVVIGMAILVSGFVHDADPDAVAAVPARARSTARPGAFVRALEGGFSAMLARLRVSLAPVLRHRARPSS